MIIMYTYQSGQEHVNFTWSADHEQHWQPYPVDPDSAISDDHTSIYSVHARCAACSCVRLLNPYEEYHLSICPVAKYCELTSNRNYYRERGDNCRYVWSSHIAEYGSPG